MSNKKMRPHSTPFLMDKYLKKDIFSTIYFQKIFFFFKRGAIFLEGGNPPTCGHTDQDQRSIFAPKVPFLGVIFLYFL
jgi:hypothetical protein